MSRSSTAASSQSIDVRAGFAPRKTRSGLRSVSAAKLEDHLGALLKIAVAAGRAAGHVGKAPIVRCKPDGNPLAECFCTVRQANVDGEDAAAGQPNKTGSAAWGGWRRKPRITPRFVETQGFSCAHSFAMPCVAKNTLIQVTTKDLREPCRVSGRNSRIFLLPM